MKIFGNLIAVKPNEVEHKIGSIIIPDSALKTMNPVKTGEVVGLGDDGNFEVSIGDKIMYVASAEVESEHGDCVLLPYNSNNILYVL